MRRLARTAPAALALALTALLAAGCTDDDAVSAGSDQPSGPPQTRALPDQQDLRDGTCRQAADDLGAVPGTVAGLGRGPAVPQAALSELATTQDRLRAFSEGAEPAVRPALDQLVVALGLARIRAVGNTYDSRLGDGVDQAYQQVLTVCTG